MTNSDFTAVSGDTRQRRAARLANQVVLHGYGGLEAQAWMDRLICELLYG